MKISSLLGALIFSSAVVQSATATENQKTGLRDSYIISLDVLSDQPTEVKFRHYQECPHEGTKVPDFKLSSHNYSLSFSPHEEAQTPIHIRVKGDISLTSKYVTNETSFF